MMNLKAVIVIPMVAIVLAGCSYRPAVLQPDMVPQSGTWDYPVEEIGIPPAKPWSETTIASGVDKKPRDGTVTYVIGEVIDVSCYLQLGKHGAKHKTCAQGCMKNGQPIGLLTREGQVFILMAEEHDPRRDGQTNLKDKLVDRAADIVKVHGTAARLGHLKALYVSGYVQQGSK